MLRKTLLAAVALIGIALGVLYLAGLGAFGQHESPGNVSLTPRPADSLQTTTERVQGAATDIGVAQSKQILFGDLHVHTTFSFDAFMMSLPSRSSEGSHPPADACDFARYCSALDFWSINDHAEQITPRHWQETIESIRQCNAVAGEGENPDTVAFLGWEWTDIGTTPENHYGHKNVVLAHTDAERIPTRPIAASSTVERARAGLAQVSTPMIGALALASGSSRVQDLALYFAERRDLDLCEDDVNVRDLPGDCLETAATPSDLFRKLDQWDVDSMVIPHGTTWGFYTPPGSTWDKQLAQEHDPNRQTLFEIYSGHGKSERYQDFRAVEYDAAGKIRCPEATEAYTPTCWRAGEIIESRCLAEGTEAKECAGRAAVARQNAVEAGGQNHLTVPGARPADWLDAGQCRDCDQPAFNYRPGGSAQYVLAIGNFEDPEKPKHFRFGFMGSSDNHFARPGTGYKEVNRHGFTESREQDPNASLLGGILLPDPVEPVAESKPFNPDDPTTGFALFQLERQSSFFTTGGLIAAHATGRDRDSVWQALERKEVYGTSGPRILLWFDLINPPGTRGLPAPMGSEVEMSRTPIFQVRAVGSYEQRPGCPEYAVSGLGPKKLDHICKNECYNPSDRRRLISRIEVVRVRPQVTADEDVTQLIEDPWRSFRCQPDPSGCAITFTDPEYEQAGRASLYYVRAVETPQPGINADNVRCTDDAEGQCIEAHLCTEAEDECLELQEPVAWSSPIFIDPPQKTAYRAIR